MYSQSSQLCTCQNQGDRPKCTYCNKLGQTTEKCFHRINAAKNTIRPNNQERTQASNLSAGPRWTQSVMCLLEKAVKKIKTTKAKIHEVSEESENDCN